MKSSVLFTRHESRVVTYRHLYVTCMFTKCDRQILRSIPLTELEHTQTFLCMCFTVHNLQGPQTSWVWKKSKGSLWTTSNWLWRDMWRTVTGYNCCKHCVQQNENIFIHSCCRFHLNWLYFVFQFNPESKLSKDNQFYNKAPTANDEVHVLVCVIHANTVSQMPEETVRKIQDIRMEANELSKTPVFVPPLELQSLPVAWFAELFTHFKVI